MYLSAFSDSSAPLTPIKPRRGDLPRQHGDPTREQIEAMNRIKRELDRRREECACAPFPRYDRRLRGLGDWTDNIAASLMKSVLPTGAGAAANPGGGNRGGGGGGGGTMTAVSTNVNTQVSPQISPVFVQQDNPSNSPVGANPVMTGAPVGAGVPVTGAIPGMDYAGGYAPTGTPYYPNQFSMPENYTPYILGAAGLLGVAMLFRATSRKGRRR